MFYLIYKITNTVNNKFYVGKHKTEDKNDGYMGSGLNIKRAIKKYGEDKFIKEILYECSSEEEMNKIERDIVDEEFVSRIDTYNVSVGGNGGWNYVNKIKTKNQKISSAKKGAKALIERNKDEKLKEEWIEKISKNKDKNDKISKTLKNRYAIKGSPWTGRKHSEKTKNKIRKSMSGKRFGENNPQFGTMWIFNNLTFENKKIKTTEEIPAGWSRGRKIRGHYG